MFEDRTFFRRGDAVSAPPLLPLTPPLPLPLLPLVLPPLQFDFALIDWPTGAGMRDTGAGMPVGFFSNNACAELEASADGAKDADTVAAVSDPGGAGSMTAAL